MLQLVNIVKEYITGGQVIKALNGINLSFRDSEFVAILGPSGCGKTTMLNIIGGLDHYTSGDLIINGRTTKEYDDHDWDAYRNHSIGFVFQSYNLINHQTILSNVELALTLSGVTKTERRKRAIAMLEKVGLGDQLNKKPNQLSGGQMQRVAIARALVNNPDIILADEPTGALDSTTSVQIMELLKEIAKDKLVIMVTHNPDLANEYATRIVNLQDGLIVNDNNPFVFETSLVNEDIKDEKDLKEKKKQEKKAYKTKSMSFFTALALSFNNLMTKKGRTILTAFAGSIGIIGIALILSVSSGVTNYINTVEESTMSSYPITVEKQNADFAALLNVYQDLSKQEAAEDGYIETNNLMISAVDSLSNNMRFNNLEAFKNYIESDKSKIKNNSTEVVYSYSTKINPYYYDSDTDTYVAAAKNISDIISGSTMSSYSSFGFGLSTFQRMIGDDDFINEQYDLVYGNMPKTPNEVVILVDKNNRIADFTLYGLGLLDTDELTKYMNDYVKYIMDPTHNPQPKAPETAKFTYDQLVGYEFKCLTNSEKKKIEGGLIVDRSVSEISDILKASTNQLKVVGIVKPSDKMQSDMVTGCVLYRQSFMNVLIDYNNNSDVVKLQKENPEINMIYNHRFDTPYVDSDYDEIKNYIDNNPTLYAKALREGYEVDKVEDMVKFANLFMLDNYDNLMSSLGYVDLDKPNSIYIYPKDFNSKDQITEEIRAYNASASENDQITYTDMVGLLISSITIIVNAISYVLIAFVSISLIVSSIMIGIITYISVLERTKEIGILRAIGASKRDVSRVFNAETVTVGFIAGVMGILISLLLIIPINQILHKLTNISYLSAVLPVLGAALLIVISIILTFIAGLIPSGVAARKDPVIALRSE